MAAEHTGSSPELDGFEINDEFEDIDTMVVSSLIGNYSVKDNSVCDRLKELEELTVEIISYVPSGKRKFLQDKLDLWRNKGGISFYSFIFYFVKHLIFAIDIFMNTILMCFIYLYIIVKLHHPVTN